VHELPPRMELCLLICIALGMLQTNNIAQGAKIIAKFTCFTYIVVINIIIHGHTIYSLFICGRIKLSTFCVLKKAQLRTNPWIFQPAEAKHDDSKFLGKDLLTVQP